MHEYFVYILQCSDGSYYTGVTNNYELRVSQHQVGLDSHCYTFKRRPVILVHLEVFQFIDEAISREKQIKRWNRKKKEALIEKNSGLLVRLSSRSKRHGSRQADCHGEEHEQSECVSNP